MRNALYFLTSLFFALLIITLVHEGSPSFTGMATFATNEQTRAVVNVLKADSAARLLGEGAEICLVVDIDNQTTYYYQLVKSGNLLDVQETYCADSGQDNVIINVNSYDDLLSARQNLRDFIIEKRNTAYYLFPSNYIQPAGEVQCTPSFQQRYCGALYKYFTSSQLASRDMVCCANYELSPEQRSALTEIRRGKEEAAAPFFFSTTGIMIIISVIVAVIIVLTIVLTRGKSPLDEYIEKTKKQGYADEQIMNYLVQSGWPAEEVAKVLRKKKK